MMMKQIVLLLLCVSYAVGLSCLDHEKNEVSWSVMFNLGNSVVTPSAQYKYFDMKEKAAEYQMTKIDSIGQPLYNSMKQMNEDPSITGIAWNDEYPSEKVYMSGAHSKGLMLIDSDKEEVMFITHSTPKYPAFVDGQIQIELEPHRTIYGQSFICLSLSLSQAEDISQALVEDTTHVYFSTLSLDPTLYPHLMALNHRLTTPPTPTLSSLLSKKIQTQFNKTLFLQGLGTVNYFYKWGRTNLHMIEDIIVHGLQQDILVESWGRPSASSKCDLEGGHSVKNILEIAIDDSNSFTYTHDHSKWLIAMDNSTCCVGDLNHMDSQLKRGGGFFCFNSPTLWQSLYQSIIKIDECH